ncbi:Cryptochrome/photolyase FAD-binding domain-containing protein [Tothia fuscella]|uniref:Cryptochrome/photolyase FAD-binding domain-containing protein n=1 Tax=Tothia fuscella TaxID=1048955 RepID=A0A9P4NVL5_9PEZI|nr:Cryptochrome/photolyase FAD-binding domain-containing protein [Tothia fuscella]
MPAPKFITNKPRVIYWFRTDLRLHDSPALRAALDLNPECLYPIWTWDPHYVYHARVGPNRWQYLIDCQNDLSSRITALNPKSRLLVLREGPETILPKLWKEWRISHIVFEKDTDAYGRERDEKIERLAKEAGVKVVSIAGRTLWDSDDVVERNGGKATMTLAQLQTAGKKLGEIARPIPPPETLPNLGELILGFAHTQPIAALDLNASHRSEADKSYETIAGPNGDLGPPTLEELGIRPATTRHRGGETVALEQMNKILADKTYTATFQKPNTAPTAFEPQATTLLSPHHHFGSLSIRQFYWGIVDVVEEFNKSGKGKASVPPTSLIGQLEFRDMYFGAHAKLGYSFSQTIGNPNIRFIPWYLPSVLDDKTGRVISGTYYIDNQEAEVWFQRWKFGRTGFPWIDALMRQLRQEGWIHHLGRHAVASFLTRGGCFVHWERGAEVFEEWLIDHETACNAGNWQWLSCTAFFSQFYRVYSPIAFPKKWDKSGNIVRKYVPELKDYDDKYIYEPWKAPIADQRKWGCMIKDDGSDEFTYPKPMFDFSERREWCLRKMKEAYDVGLHGNDEKVKDGSWRSLFGDELGNKGDVKLMSIGDIDAGDNGAENVVTAVISPGNEDKGTVIGQKRKASKSQGTLDGLVKRIKKS